VPIQRLKEFYDTFYHPNNATLTLVGHLSRPQVFAMIDKHFGKIPKSSVPVPPVYTDEPRTSLVFMCAPVGMVVSVAGSVVAVVSACALLNVL
jgi:predicted Zn-dependent peptidase